MRRRHLKKRIELQYMESRRLVDQATAPAVDKENEEKKAARLLEHRGLYALLY